jgi:hypothetical protein
MWLCYLLHLLALTLRIFLAQNGQIFATVYFLISALFLGSVVFAMVLGHWYLVTPKLSEKPLLRTVIAIWPLLILKMIFTFVAYTKGSHFFESGTHAGAGYAFNWLMFSMRVLWGYVVVAGMNYFSQRLVKMRSIQSATGILYAMTFFTIVGELVAIFLFYKLGLTL